MIKIIPKYVTYPGGEREVEVLENQIEFILSQPQEFWLLYVLTMNWDQGEDLANAIIDRADADMAIIAEVFWSFGPGFYVENPDRFPGSPIERILQNTQAGWYPDSKFWLPQSHLAAMVTGFLKSAKQMQPPAFEVPHTLFGPFFGTKAIIDFPVDMESFDLLATEWPMTGCGLDLSKAKDADFWDKYEHPRTQAILPTVLQDHMTQNVALDMFAYGESIYVTRDAIEEANATPEQRRAMRRQRALENRPQSPIKFINRLTSLQQGVAALAFLSGWFWLAVRIVDWIF